jgi:hypothetical protein
MEEQALPEEIRKKASVSTGGEHAWRMADFEEAVLAAASANLAVVGGQVQFQLSDGVCEPYWLDYDAARRAENEPWDVYVRRSASEILTAFRSLCARTDFREEAMTWEFIRDKVENESIDPTDYLWFVLYFAANDAS